MGVKEWRKKRKLKKLKGVAAIDHGVMRSNGIEKLQRWEHKSEIKYWGPISGKEAYNFYMSMPDVKASPRLGSIAEFRKWDAKRKKILETAETEFRNKERIDPNLELSRAEKNRLGEFTRQKINQIVDQLGSRI
jgi:hypothetical protein